MELTLADFRGAIKIMPSLNTCGRRFSPARARRTCMSAVDPHSAVSSPKPPLKERLWNLFGILFYLTVAVGIFYHFILPLF